MKIPNAERAYVDMQKLVEYALNPEHPYGKDKALVFKSVLGITSSEADLLRDELIKAVQSMDAIVGEKNEYGERFRIDFEMTGPNKRTATIRSAWIIRFDEDFPRLATVYVI